MISVPDFRAMRSALLLTVLLLLPGTSAALSPAPVWSVGKDGQLLFIGGTVHMLPPSAFPLPDPFDFAYDLSSVVVFETDMQAFQQPDMQALFAEQMLLPPGQTVKQAVTSPTYALLVDHLRERGMPVEALEHLKPSMVAIMLTTLELQRLGLGETGVDQHYLDRALLDGKRVGWLEEVEQHIRYIVTMAEGAEDDFLRYSLQDIAQLKPYMSQMVATWRAGDVAGLDKLFLRDMSEIFPALYASIVVQRNDAWLPQIEAMLQTPDIEFVLVGAAHLVGEDGVLEKLQARGYEVKQLTSLTP